MKQFLLALIMSLVLAAGAAYAMIGSVSVVLSAAAQNAAQERVAAKIIRCYPLIEDFEFELGITLCLWHLPPPLPPSERPVPEKEARVPELTF